MLDSNVASILVKTASGKTVSIFENSDLCSDCWYRTPIPAPPLVPLNPPEAITQVIIMWGTGQGAANERPNGNVEFKLLGFPAFDTSIEVGGLFGAEVQLEQNQVRALSGAKRSGDYRAELSDRANPAWFECSSQWMEADEAMLMSWSVTGNVAEKGFFQDDNAKKGLWGAKMLSNVTYDTSMHVDVSDAAAGKMGSLQKISVNIREDHSACNWNTGVCVDYEEYSDSEIFLKMSSSHSPPDSTNQYGCEQTVVHLWSTDTEDDDASEYHSGPGCYYYEYQWTPSSSCECHPSCAMCGYSSSPTAADDCISCADPTTVVEAVYPDGTGYCNGKKKEKYNTLQSAYDFSPVSDNPNVLDLRVEGCFETLGGSSVYVDGEDQGKIEVR